MKYESASPVFHYLDEDSPHTPLRITKRIFEMKKYKYQIKTAKFNSKNSEILCELSFKAQEKSEYQKIKSFIATIFLNQIKRSKQYLGQDKKTKLLTMRFSEDMHLFITSLKHASGLNYNDLFEVLMRKAKIIITEPDPILADLEQQRLIEINKLRAELAATFKNMNQIAKHINTMAIDDFKDFDPNEINALLLSIDCSLNNIRGLYDR
ncbi:MAG: hypothetical protein V7736_06560 [Colwellia polaris]